jgi:hypothetical protein
VLKDERGEIRALLLELIREVKAQRGQTGEVNKRKRAY